MSLNKLIQKILKEADAWDKKYLDVTVHAIRRFESEESAQELIYRFLNEECRGTFNLANPSSKRLLLRELLPALLSHLVDDTKAESLRVTCAMATFLHDDWNFPEGGIEFDIGKAKKLIRNALAGFDFIARFEAVTYQNEYWQRGALKGPLVCFHCHCIIWTSASYSKLERLRKSLKHRFPRPLSREDGPHFARIKSPEGLGIILGYISKMPARGKRTDTTLKEYKVQRSRVISKRSYYELFKELRKHDMYTFWLSGGEGAKILRETRSRLRARADCGRSHDLRGRRFWRGSHPGARWGAYRE
ncbi:MAG: hypothetical protein AB1490_05365 [Pseudomonadota bacterium]